MRWFTGCPVPAEKQQSRRVTWWFASLPEASLALARLADEELCPQALLEDDRHSRHSLRPLSALSPMAETSPTRSRAARPSPAPRHDAGMHLRQAARQWGPGEEGPPPLLFNQSGTRARLGTGERSTSSAWGCRSRRGAHIHGRCHGHLGQPQAPLLLSVTGAMCQAAIKKKTQKSYRIRVWKVLVPQAGGWCSTGVLSSPLAGAAAGSERGPYGARRLTCRLLFFKSERKRGRKKKAFDKLLGTNGQ